MFVQIEEEEVQFNRTWTITWFYHIDQSGIELTTFTNTTSWFLCKRSNISKT